MTAPLSISGRSADLPDHREASPADEKIIRFEALRALLEEKFPDARADTAPPAEDAPQPALVPPGIVTEISGSTGSVSLALQAALEAAPAFAGLVDASNGFDPADLAPSCLRRLLWVRCPGIDAAVQAVDFLLRDGNLPLILLDLRRVSASGLRSVPSSTWHRFQRLLESGENALGICTAKACIPAARLRWQADSRWSLRDLLRPREELSAALRLRAIARGAMPGALERRMA